MNVLTLSTYPIDAPSHGGQHRLHHIVQAYRQAGHAVQVAGVLGSGAFPPCAGFAPYPVEARLTRDTGESPQLEELTIGALFAADDHYFAALAARISPAPDLIHVEQPWLLAFALRYRERFGIPNCKILYSSQNIEHDMKFEIIRHEAGLAAAHAARDKVLQCEVAAIAAADLLVAVAQTDLDWARRHTSAASALAPNGVQDRSSTEAGIREANAITGCRQFALYCGSAHPPNMNGFFETMGASIGCIGPHQKIVIAGGAGPSIAADARFAQVGGLERLCVVAGVVSETCLQGLLDTAHAIILPITQGGGTNLKTAEALWSGRHIVATSMAMRGYEHFVDAQGLVIADGTANFLPALRAVMARPPLQIAAAERECRRSLLWQATLQPLLALVAA